MANKIDTVSGRAKLAPRREPYWQRISVGVHIGFRKMNEGTSGTWIFRERDASGKETQSKLGSLEAYKAHERFDRAVEVAQSGRGAIDTTAPVEFDRMPLPAYSVEDACQDYVERIEELKGEKSARSQDARYARWVEPDPIARVQLVALTADDLTAFRRRLLKTPVVVNKAGTTRSRSKDTVNRDVAALRAALNHALERGKVATDLAWRAALKAYKNAGKRRSLYLDRNERRELIASASDDVARFLTALSILPLRPGALAALTVEHLDTRLHVLNIGRDKSGQDRKIKLPHSAVALFSADIDKRSPKAPLFARANGVAWNKDSWFEPIRAAAKKAGLPKNVSAYTLRHSIITDLVVGNLDLLTVAQLSGTSVAMIEKHYGHLRHDVAAEALAKLML